MLPVAEHLDEIHKVIAHFLIRGVFNPRTFECGFQFGEERIPSFLEANGDLQLVLGFIDPIDLPVQYLEFFVPQIV